MGFKIEICKDSKVNELIYFIDKFWKKDHVFVHNRALFDWQHKNGSNYNFVIASQNDEIIGILGFIPTSQYSRELEVNNEIWLAIWKVRDDVKKPGLGLMMLNFLKKHLNNPSICSIGLSKEVISLYKVFKYEIGILGHTAFFNQEKKQFNFMPPPQSHLVLCEQNNISFTTQVGSAELNACKHLFISKPQKNIEYLFNRYVNHPTYKYEIILFEENNQPISIVVYRKAEIREGKIARIVDVLGSNIMDSKFNYAISKFLNENDLEYIDLVSNLERSQKSGFIENNSEFIVPNYFEPLEIKNIAIDYAYKSEHSFSIFRGDSDQDRPNL